MTFEEAADKYADKFVKVNFLTLIHPAGQVL